MEPSHTLLLVVTLLAIGAQLVVILISLKINTKRLEDSVDKIDTKIDVVQSDIRKEIRDVREELRGEIREVRTELKLRFKVSGAKSPMSEPN